VFPNGKFLDAKNDLFAILLKCDENESHLDTTFEDLQKTIQNKEGKVGDLLYQSHKLDWPLLAVIAAMTKQYQVKFCWISWIILSSDYEVSEKQKTFKDLSKSVVVHCLEKGFIKVLDDSFTIFFPDSSMKILTNFLWKSKNGEFEDIEKVLKEFIVKLTSDNYDMVFIEGKAESIAFTMKCLVKHLQINFQSSTLHQEKFLDILCRSEIAQFYDKIDFILFKKMCKILEKTNMRVNFEELCWLNSKNLSEAVAKICECLINDHQFEAAIELAELLNLPQREFVSKWWFHMWSCEDKNSKNFETKKYLRYVQKYNLSMEVLINFVKKVLENLEPSVKKVNMMKFLLRNSWMETAGELDQLEYEIISLYLKLKIENDSSDLKPLMSEYFESVISKEKCIIFNSLYELKAIAKVDELTISHKSLSDEVEIVKLDELMFQLLDAGDIIQVLRIQEMFGRAPEDLKLLVFMMSIAENINSIYDIAKEERKMISSFGLMSNKFNRYTLKSLRTSSSSEFFIEFL
jgi:spatacsin